MKRLIISLIGHLMLLLDAAFLLYTLHDAIAYSAFHLQGVMLILVVAFVFGLGAYLCFMYFKPDLKSIYLRMFWIVLLLYWSIIVAGNTVLNDAAYGSGTANVSFKIFSTIQVWLENGIYIPFFSHLIVLFPYCFCLPFLFRRRLKIIEKIQWLLVMCLVISLLWIFVLCKPICVDNILLWIIGGILGYLVHEILVQGILGDWMISKEH